MIQGFLAFKRKALFDTVLRMHIGNAVGIVLSFGDTASDMCSGTSLRVMYILQKEGAVVIYGQDSGSTLEALFTEFGLVSRLIMCIYVSAHSYIAQV